MIERLCVTREAPRPPADTGDKIRCCAKVRIRVGNCVTPIRISAPYDIMTRGGNCVKPIRISAPYDILTRIPLAAVVAVVSLFGGFFWLFGVGLLVLFVFGGGFAVVFFFKLVLRKVVRAPTPSGALK